MSTSDTRFAVYLVPSAEDAFYQLGSAVLGYDVRAARPVPRLPEVEPEWTAKAGQYGFHLTLLEAFECDVRRFPEIEAEIERVCACIAPTSRLHLGGARTEVWDDDTVIVRRFDASTPVLVLHTLLLARLAPFVTGSSFERMTQRDPKRYSEAYERARLHLFHTPRGLDTWEPHFTLVEPYTGMDVHDLAAHLDDRFEPYPTLELGTVTLLRQDGRAPFRIVQDFPVGAGRAGEEEILKSKKNERH